MCQRHWDELRREVEARGLAPFIASDGREATRRMALELEKGPSRETFDPLLYAHAAIMRNAMRVMGLTLLMPNADGTERCPLCFVETEAPEGHPARTEVPKWLGFAAEDALAMARTYAEDAPPSERGRP